jgi:pimeloyl-ACP methyl ester carboxylesterase
MLMTQKVAVTDSRAVTVNSWGDPNGFPILLLHGTPGSSSGPVPRSSVLYRLGIRLICYDRPGYGDSCRHPGRTVADAASDVLALADEMKLGEFSVVGRSGGGPHALACAATIDSGRLRNVAVLVGLAPTDAPDWFDGMADSNIEEYELVGDDRTAVIADLTERARQIRADPESLLLALEKEMTEYDREIVTDFSFRRLLTESYREALRFGPFGWIDDVLAFRGPWGFALDKISVPVQLWHGQDDVFTPAHHSRWLAAQIPGASIHIQPRAAHFDAMVVLPRILARLKADSMDTAADAEAAELVRL